MSITEDVDEQAMMARWDRAMRALAAEPRRQTVLSLLEADPDRELTLPAAANPSYALYDPGRLRTELVHTHLPLLAEGDYVRWREQPFTVRRGPAFEEVAAVMASLWEGAERLPDGLVEGCQRLEEARREARR